VRAVVLSDTHIRRGTTRRLPDEVYAALAEADVVLHAGDLVVGEVLDELTGFAPVHAVLGNNDHELVGILPETVVVELDGVRVAMVHDSGPTAGRAGRMARRFPGAALVVFGHSHAPVDALGMGDQRMFNPGSPTERRSQPWHTYGVIDLRDGEVVDHRIVPV
jgi:putative phosphoesterase